MPYIEEWRRKEGIIPTSPGELNYLFTEIIMAYVEQSQKGLSYQIINDIMGALEGAKLEFYRRVAVPYENQKCLDNGDVY